MRTAASARLWRASWPRAASSLSASTCRPPSSWSASGAATSCPERVSQERAHPNQSRHLNRQCCMPFVLSPIQTYLPETPASVNGQQSALSDLRHSNKASSSGRRRPPNFWRWTPPGSRKCSTEWRQHNFVREAWPTGIYSSAMQIDTAEVRPDGLFLDFHSLGRPRRLVIVTTRCIFNCCLNWRQLTIASRS